MHFIDVHISILQNICFINFLTVQYFNKCHLQYISVVCVILMSYTIQCITATRTIKDCWLDQSARMWTNSDHVEI